MKKILFIASHRKDRAPNQRFRFEQYFSFLESNGFQCTLSPLITTAAEDKLFYSAGNYFKKIPLGIKLALRRFKDAWRANDYDIIFIAREAFILGSIFFERRLARSKAKIVFDFDDSIWMNVVSSNNRLFSWLKDGGKTAKIIAMSDIIFAGNEYLATFARKHNRNVIVIPTTIDTEIYLPKPKADKAKIIIGWSGSVSTVEHFQYALPALKLVKEKYGNRVEIKLIGDGNYKNEELNIVGLPWKMETELSDLQTFDIGIMPLPDNEWTWGKCGLKGLQYMALEIPTIMSHVGVNREIITHGVNGYLANTVSDWFTILSDLIENEDLRYKIGREGRNTVVEKFSVISLQENYLKQFQLLIAR